MEGIRRYVDKIDIVCLERALMISLERAEFEFSSFWKPTFTLQFDSMDESLCKALVLGCCFLIQCIVLLMVVFNMYCNYVVKLLYSWWFMLLWCCLSISQWNLVSPSSGVASLRLRLGGEPPWFTIFISHMQVPLDELESLEFLLFPHVHRRGFIIAFELI